MTKSKQATLWAILAAALYALSSPISKLLLQQLDPMAMASLLYLGAGIGMFVIFAVRYTRGKLAVESKLSLKELPFIIAMVLLDIIAPFFLMLGLSKTTAANASLLNNFEIVATAVIALFIFREMIPKRLWYAIGFITLSSVILSFEDVSSFSFSIGSIFVLLACTCWGLENNCTRVLSKKDPLQIVIIKGIGSGLGALMIATMQGASFGSTYLILVALLLGFVSYGLSIFFYVSAQRELGAAKTSTYYAIAPFIGVALSLIIFRALPPMSFFLALVIMIFGVYLTST
jgi:drug/metabolite transporter (DMT)-like permease